MSDLFILILGCTSLILFRTNSSTLTGVILRLHDVERGGFEHSALKRKIERKTTLVKDNGFCMKFNGSGCFAFTVNSGDVAMLEFIVMNSEKGFNDEEICTTAVPLSCLRQGIRAVQFYDKCSRQHGPFGLARVLVDVEYKLSDGHC